MTGVREIAAEPHPVRVYDLRPQAPPSPSILVLKLDHLGDLVIAAPSLRRLREAFPGSAIRLVVGSWNREAAEALGVADEVRTLDVFSPAGGGALHPPSPEALAAAAGGAFDIAVDLRVDGDTRPLLAAVDARLRCGIDPLTGSHALDVVLPAEERWRSGWSPRQRDVLRLEPGRFTSHAPVRKPLHHEAPLRPAGGHLVYGPHLRLPEGPLEVRLDLAVAGQAPLWGRTIVTVDVAREGAEIGVHRRLRARDLPRPGGEGVPLVFTNDSPASRYEIRVHLSGPSSPGRLVFGGAQVTRLGDEPPPRRLPTVLHTGERLSQLVQLVSDRAVALHPPAPELPRSGEIVVAPFSNSDLRDWPAASYAVLVARLARETGRRVVLTGAPRQREALEALRLASGGGDGIVNLGGRTTWAELPERLRRADLVICNNSGVAHAAAAAGARVLALYSASHTPPEWGPRGARAEAMMTATPCSPCGFDILAECPFGHRCMTELTPEIVFAEALRRLEA